MTPNELLTAALRYAELGYRVFPCAPGTKVPLTEHGFHDATIDPDQIERWWTQHPSANVAVATEGLVIIDIDGDANSWPGGNPERMFDLAAGPMAITPRGGSHRVFRQPAGKGWRCTEGRLAPKVDTRADGGYIVAPPSVIEGGKAYRWAPGLELDDPPDRLPEPPPWLAQELDGLANGTPTSAHVAAGPPEANQIPKGQRNATLARLAGAMRRVGMSQAEMAAALLRVNADRCAPPLPPREVERIASSVARYEPDQVAVALAENHWDQMYAEGPGDEAPDNPDPGPIPDELLCVPGFIGEVMTYTLQTAPYPERALAFCGALSLQALLAGRKVRDAADNRTNLYVLGLANSGAGKDYPRKVNQKVLLEAGLTESLGDTFASGEGIEDRLFLHPSVLFQTDEIDGLMTKINLGKDARHEGIMNVLLKMYTSASALYPMRVKAGKEPGVIDQPCLCIFGTAIPKHYYEALSLKMLTNGFFARMLILETGKRGRGQDAVVRDLPAPVLATARWWADFCPGEKRGNLADWHPIPKVVEATPEAADVLRAFRQRADDQYSLAEDKGDPVGMAIWARANEKARRLALVYACSANHLDPRIDADAARWACAFVEHQTRRMLFMAGEYVSENEFDARCKKLVVTLRKWQEKHGDAWMPFWQINRKHPWSEREHEEVRTTLLNQRLIEYTEVRTAGRPSKLYRLLGAS
ncbi:MAG: hypothetical protein KatS3mg109_0549 [Pirellulaceae bacterium]|nr:MAG: hypothetical protein KatS3mg109_0549 [Pirellulaceae bacterium]